MARIVRSLSDQKAQTRFLKEREQLLYTDVLTGFHNRNYFSHNLNYANYSLNWCIRERLN